jgi:alkylated DNA repair dioxygenase AlkB
MNPFDDIHTKSRRWSLDDEGIDVTYDADFLPTEDADRLFEALKKEINWHRAVIQTAGGPKTVPRMISWHADEGLTYSYSGLTHPWKPWTPAMQEIKAAVEKRLGVSFNGCLANFYESARDSVSMHSDDEGDMEEGAPIASVSLGAVREFIMKHKETKTRHVIPLEHGSLVVMAGDTQKVSRHGIPKSRHSCGPRINLTFRRTLTR